MIQARTYYNNYINNNKDNKIIRWPLPLSGPQAGLADLGSVIFFGFACGRPPAKTVKGSWSLRGFRRGPNQDQIKIVTLLLPWSR